eukprot:jgi/Chlat1/1307/Chrsp118S01740
MVSDGDAAAALPVPAAVVSTIKQASTSSLDGSASTQPVVQYLECMRNLSSGTPGPACHDGCQEFTAADDPLLCSICGCKRAFHKRIVAPCNASALPAVPHTLEEATALLRKLNEGLEHRDQAELHALRLIYAAAHEGSSKQSCRHCTTVVAHCTMQNSLLRARLGAAAGPAAPVVQVDGPEPARANKRATSAGPAGETTSDEADTRQVPLQRPNKKQKRDKPAANNPTPEKSLDDADRANGAADLPFPSPRIGSTPSRNGNSPHIQIAQPNSQSYPGPASVHVSQNGSPDSSMAAAPPHPSARPPTPVYMHSRPVKMENGNVPSSTDVAMGYVPSVGGPHDVAMGFVPSYEMYTGFAGGQTDYTTATDVMYGPNSGVEPPFAIMAGASSEQNGSQGKGGSQRITLPGMRGTAEQLTCCPRHEVSCDVYHVTCGNKTGQLHLSEEQAAIICNCETCKQWPSYEWSPRFFPCHAQFNSVGGWKDMIKVPGTDGRRLPLATALKGKTVRLKPQMRMPIGRHLDRWLQCTACGKWRKFERKNVRGRRAYHYACMDPNWTCAQHVDPKSNNCAIKQELPSEEVFSSMEPGCKDCKSGCNECMDCPGCPDCCVHGCDCSHCRTAPGLA